jgi:hypothetical protein
MTGNRKRKVYKQRERTNHDSEVRGQNCERNFTT